MGTNWFMPALVNRRFGESGMRLEDGTMVCCFDLKKSRNDWRICADVIIFEAAESLVKKFCAGERKFCTGRTQNFYEFHGHGRRFAVTLSARFENRKRTNT